MLFDRKIEWSDSKEDEWELVKSKASNGVELPLPDSDRWFKATTKGHEIVIETAELNVRPLVIRDSVILGIDEFIIVAENYNAFLGVDARTMSTTHAVKDATPHLRFFFMLIYHLL